MAPLKLVDPDTRAASDVNLPRIIFILLILPSFAEYLTNSCAVKGGVFGPIGISARGARRGPFMVPATAAPGHSCHGQMALYG